MKCKIISTGEVRIHNTLHNTAHHFKTRLDSHYSGEKKISGADLEKLSCLTFLAFTVEAHANFIADVGTIPKWDKFWPWKDKLKAILKDREHGLDWNKPPLSQISKLFELRDCLAHGRPFSDALHKEVDVKVADPEKHKELICVVAPWEKILESINYVEAYNAVDNVWQELLRMHQIDPIDTLCNGGYKVAYSSE